MRVLKFRLAEQMGCTVAELEARMSAREFNEWAAFRVWERKKADQAKHAGG